MSVRIITISRQFGSAGHSIGELVAKKLGIKFYDSELVTKIAEKSGFDASFIRENGEQTSSGSGLFYDMGMYGGASFAPLSLYDQLYITQHNIIRELADKEPCVIVGRCSDYVLEDRDDCLHTFIYAATSAPRGYSRSMATTASRSRSASGIRIIREALITAIIPTANGEIPITIISALTAASSASKSVPI